MNIFATWQQLHDEYAGSIYRVVLLDVGEGLFELRGRDIVRVFEGFGARSVPTYRPATTAEIEMIARDANAGRVQIEARPRGSASLTFEMQVLVQATGVPV